MEMQKIQNIQSNPEKEQLKSLKLPDCKTYYKALVNMTVCCWHKDRKNRHTHTYGD